jgi:hypothetical protein
MQMLQEKSVAELTRLGFTASVLLKDASVREDHKSNDHVVCTSGDSYERIHTEYAC